MFRASASVVAVTIAMIDFGAVGSVLAGEVRGKVVMAPMCPGPAQPGVECPAKPVAAKVDVFALASGARVKSIATSRSGQFRLTLAAGRYRFQARVQTAAALSKPAEVTVKGTGITWVTVTIDTGMR